MKNLKQKERGHPERPSELLMHSPSFHVSVRGEAGRIPEANLG